MILAIAIILAINLPQPPDHTTKHMAPLGMRSIIEKGSKNALCKLIAIHTARGILDLSPAFHLITCLYQQSSKP
jgi:hypothetical protein